MSHLPITRSSFAALATLWVGCWAGAQANFTSPSIGGELMVLSPKFDTGTLKPTSAIVGIEKEGGKSTLRVAFQTGADYPNVQFPVPAGGWNLSAFGAVQVDVTNPGKEAATIYIRVDNPGDWHLSPWNTASTSVPPGETKVLKCIFGQSGYKLDPAHVSAIQVFVIKPEHAITLSFSDLKAVGSPTDRAIGDAFSSISDLKKPVTPPSWLGTRPPVPGEWIQTLNEKFSGSSINEKVWGERFHWDGLLAAQTNAYAPDEVSIGGGTVKLRAEKKETHAYGDPKLGVKPYGTGLLCTWGKWTQTYGYFEARIKLPTARGLWPAFWMMPDRGVAAGDGGARESTSNGGMEYDILEHLTEWGPGRYNVAVHWDGYEADHKSWGNANTYYGPTADGWHNWGILWEPGRLTWYCDGIKKAEFVSRRVGKAPMYIILNVQMGGWATKDVDDAHLPDSMQVAYVKAWKRKS